MEEKVDETEAACLKTKVEINEATVKEVAAQLRKIGDEINEECTKRALPAVMSRIGAEKLLWLLRELSFL